MLTGSEMSGALPACPACHSLRVARGTLTASNAYYISFSFQEIEIDPWKFIREYPSLKVDPGMWVCVECGLLWSSIDRTAARRQIEMYGSEAMKVRTLNPAETLPRPASAPELEERNLPLPSRDGNPEAKSDP